MCEYRYVKIIRMECILAIPPACVCVCVCVCVLYYNCQVQVDQMLNLLQVSLLLSHVTDV